MIPEVSLDLLKKYDKAGPRYTSYPTAPHFRPDVLAEEIHRERSVALLERLHQPLSLYFHVPFCPVICLYCGCHTSPTSDRDRIQVYMDAMLGELRGLVKRYPSRRPVHQIHFGGGTPTHAGLAALRAVLAEVRHSFVLAPDAEIACEVDPRQVDAPGLAELRAMGFNRISFGIQDIDPDVQRAVGRVQSAELCLGMIRAARDLGFSSVNVDLIYGLPRQTLDSQRRTIAFALEQMRPDRLALFNFAYLPKMKPHQLALDAAAMPSPEVKLAMLKQGIDLMVQGGYEFIGMDHFALPGDDMARARREGRLHRNFQGYTTLADADVVAFGVSSISQFAAGYSQNLKDEKAYIECVGSGHDPLERGIVLTNDDLLRREVIAQILCRDGIDKRQVESRFSIEFDSYFADALAKMEEMCRDGLVGLDGSRISVTPLGRLFVRNLAMLFDAWLERTAPTGLPQYSRTV
jgi:oxygen-independent coproporphyrinogen-3 oxidase